MKHFALLPLLLSGLVLFALYHVSHSARSASVPPTIDPRLVLHARTTVLHFQAGGLRLAGSLAPSLPGHNTLRLRVLHHPGYSIAVVADMPGMRMTPSRALVSGRKQSAIALTMFGRYRVRFTVRGAGRVWSGAGTVLVPLPGE